MVLQATSATALPSVWQPEPFPAKLRLAPADPAAPERGEGRLRPLEVADCTMCGVTRPLGLLVSDGGTACADVRWYCKDVRSCTERWTTALPQQPEGLPQETQPATPLRPPPAGRPPGYRGRLERGRGAGTTPRSAKKGFTSAADGRAAVACRRYLPRTR
jgi:hypothetical protein